ncbi:hypothetical protein RH831_05740 [Halodesulfurarchaeum sp. HSR-GB]|nr:MULTISPECIES: hypothetical protein [Halodesulfurarchaeum]MDR5656680.1 hypothetical protein [Halodesulfurarchaeum sp. HSR-GB]
MPAPPTPGRNPFDHPIGGTRERALTAMATNLRKIPGTTNVRFESSTTGVDEELVGELDPNIYGDGILDVAAATVTLNWWPQPDSDAYWYRIHYHDSSGFDCGWHRHENDHVDGLDHYQERDSPDEDYVYYPFEPEYTNPIGLVWEIVDGRLSTRLEMRYGEG